MNILISWHRRFGPALAACGANRSGTAAVLLAIALPAVIGMAGLATEGANWYMTKRSMQGAADAAAYTAAVAKASGASNTWITTEARSIAAGYGFTNGVGGVTVSVNSPPLSGSHTTDSNAVEVIVRETMTPMLSAVIVSTGPTVVGRSVVVANSSGNGCVLALDKGDVVDINDSGSTTLNMTSCSMFINSNNSAALTVSGSATTNVNAVYVVGGDSIGSSAHLNTTNGVHTGMQPLNDPYVNVAIPTYSGCDQNNFGLNGSASQTITPAGSTYVFCNGISLQGSSTLTLSPGTYIIDRGSLTMAGGSTLTGTGGVTIILTSSTNSGYATTAISGGANISLTAPSTGSLAGLAIFQDRNAPTSGSSSMSGGGTQNITGAIYFPNQPLSYNGGASSGGSVCTQLIAYKLTFTGSSNLSSSCSGVGTKALGLPGGTFVE